MKKRILGVMLALCMLLSVLPLTPVVSAAVENVSTQSSASATGAEVVSVKINGTPNGGFNKYAVKVSGTASKVQVIFPNSNTYTFDRSGSEAKNDNSRGVVSIKAYDKNDNEVALSSDSIAYELWVINMSLKEGTYTVRAKYKTTWVDGGKSLTVSYSATTLDEVKVTKAEGKNGSYSFKLNGTAQKIQIIHADGQTNTLTKSSSSVSVKYYNSANTEVDKDSGEVAYEIWTINKKYNDGSYSVIAKYNNGSTYVWGTTALAFDIANGEVDITLDSDKLNALSAFTYEKNSDGKVKITGVKDTSVTELTVPDFVYEIAFGAFKDCTSLQKLTVPYVGNRSNGEYGSIGYFFGAKSWKNHLAVMPESLTNITVTGGYSNDEKLQANAFNGCIYLTDVTVNDGVTYIGSSILGNCISLENLTLPFIGSTKMGKNDINSFTRSDFYYVFNEYSKDSLYADETYRVIVRKNLFYDENWWSNNLVENYEIAVPKSLTSITILGGAVPFRAFYPDSIWDTTDNYQYYSPITSITLGENVSCIGDQAFHDLTNLKNLTALGTLTDIGSRAFTDSMIGDITWYQDQPDGCVYLGNAVVGYKGSVPTDGCITIKDGTVAIANNVFSGMSDLLKVELPNSLKYIGTEMKWLTDSTYGAFNGCPNLKTVSGGSVEKLGYVAFKNCTSLTDISFAENVTYIAEYALKDSGWYNNKAAEGGTVYVGKVFYKYFESENEENTTVEIEEGTVGIASSAFSKSGFDESNPDGYTSIVKIVVPDTVAYIGSYAFAGCTNLKEINLPSALNQIGGYAFYGCSSLSGTLTIPKNVKTLPRSIFQGCGDITIRFEQGSKLTTVFYRALYGLSENSVVYLPESVIYIEKEALVDNTAIIVLETDKITAANAVACSSAKNIFYAGSKQTANGLTDVFSDVYYYSETEPPVNASTGMYDANYWHYDENGKPVIWTVY